MRHYTSREELVRSNDLRKVVSAINSCLIPLNRFTARRHRHFLILTRYSRFWHGSDWNSRGWECILEYQSSGSGVMSRSRDRSIDFLPLSQWYYTCDVLEDRESCFVHMTHRLLKHCLSLDMHVIILSKIKGSSSW